jgi:hypothetical protein
MRRTGRATLWTTLATTAVFGALIWFGLTSDDSDLGFSGGAAVGGLIIIAVVALACVVLMALIFPFAAAMLADLGQVGYPPFLAAIAVTDVAAAVALCWGLDGWNVKFWAVCFGLLFVATAPSSALWWWLASPKTKPPDPGMSRGPTYSDGQDG